MRILYISQYFPPEMGAPAARVHELSRAWVRLGHSVTVLTAFPHHPTGVIPPEYRGKRFMREETDGIEVLRTWVYATPNKGFLRRTLSYLSFMWSAMLIGIPVLSGRKFDVVIGTSPQFFVAVAALKIASFLRSPFVFEVRDLWPASIEAVGAITDRRIIRFLESIEMMLYRRARLIVAVAESTVGILSKRGISESKIAVVKNGVDLDKFRPSPRDNDVREEYGLQDKFVCSYIGTIGMAHALDVVLDAAEATRDDEKIVYVVVGEGARKEELERAASSRGLGNVIFTGQQPRERVTDFLAASDAVLVHLKDTELFQHVIPSKIFEIMAARRPIIMGVGGEAGRIVEEAGAGIAIKPEDAGDLVEAVRRLRDNPKDADSLAVSGRAYVEKHFNRDRLAEDYINHLEGLL